jgi:hypothetical protein
MVNWIINRAKRTPYFHLTGYMERFWLVPYNVEIERREIEYDEDGQAVGAVVLTDGTGMVPFSRRPFTWVLQKLGIAARVHHILRSDLGRDPHDHPWPYLTVILKGGYFEQRFDDHGFLIDTVWHGPGSVLFRRANSWHKLIVPEGETAWTLFITGKKSQTWGFNTPAGKIPYHQYKETL